MRRAVGDLSGLGVERERARMPVDALDVDLAARPLLLLECCPAGELDRACRHPGHARRGCRAGRADCARGRTRQRDVLDPELRARDLEDDVRDALPDLRPGAEHLGPRAGELHTGGAEVVEPLRVADVLEAGREADAAADSLTVRRVAGATG